MENNAADLKKYKVKKMIKKNKTQRQRLNSEGKVKVLRMQDLFFVTIFLFNKISQENFLSFPFLSSFSKAML